MRWFTVRRHHGPCGPGSLLSRSPGACNRPPLWTRPLERTNHLRQPETSTSDSTLQDTSRHSTLQSHAQNKYKRINKRGDQLASFGTPTARWLPVSPCALQHNSNGVTRSGTAAFWNRWTTPSRSTRDGVICPSLRDQGTQIDFYNLDPEQELAASHHSSIAFQADFTCSTAVDEAARPAAVDLAPHRAVTNLAEDEAHRRLLRSQRQLAALLGMPKHTRVSEA